MFAIVRIVDRSKSPPSPACGARGRVRTTTPAPPVALLMNMPTTGARQLLPACFREGGSPAARTEVPSLVRLTTRHTA